MVVSNKFKTREEIDAINAEHCEVIKGMMENVLSDLGPGLHGNDVVVSAGGTIDDSDDDSSAAGSDEEEEESAAKKRKTMEKPVLVKGTGVARKRHDMHEMKDMLSLPKGKHKKFISIAEVMTSADAQHNAILEKPWYVTEKSSRDVVAARYIHANCEELIKKIPIRCKWFELLVVQRLAIMVMISPLPKETFTELEITEESMRKITGLRARKQPFNVAFNIEEGALPNFTITIIATMAALILLCDKDSWEELRSEYDQILRARRREPHSGLCKGATCEKAKLARLAIAFVPNTVYNHWFEHGKAAMVGIQEIFGTDLDIQVIKGNVARGSIQEIYETGKPTFWIVSQTSESLNILRKTPSFGYAVRIYDELNVKARSKYDQQESQAIFNYVTQATIEALKQATYGQPRQPLRLALGDNFVPISEVCKEGGLEGKYPKVQQGLEHLCKLRQFAAPEFLRRLVAEGVQYNMPSGMVVQRLQLRVSTLNGAYTGSDMVQVTLPQLAVNMMGTGVHDNTRRKVAQLMEDRFVFSADEICSKLSAAHGEMTATTFGERNSKDAVGRCLKHMRETLEKRLPNCPVTGERQNFHTARVLSCCTAVIAAKGLKQTNGECPFCSEKPLSSLAPAVEEASEDDEKAKEPPESPSMVQERKPEMTKKESKKCKADEEEEEEWKDDDEGSLDQHELDKKERLEKDSVLEKKIEEISNKKMAMLDGIVAVLNAQLDRNVSSRILLCFGFATHQNVVVKKLIDRIKKEVGHGFAEVTDVESMMKNESKATEAKQRFDNPVKYSAPQIFVLNTRATSSSVQGMDLFATDLTLVADECNLTIQRQAAGRSLRMRPRPKWMKSTDRFPPKRLVVAQVTTFDMEELESELKEEGGSGPHNEHAVEEDVDEDDYDPMLVPEAQQNAFAQQFMKDKDDDFDDQ